MPFQAGGVGGVKTLSDLEIDVDKDWKAHGIYNLGDLTPKIDGAYNLGESGTKFDTVYAGLMSDSIYKRNLRTGVVDTSYLTDNAATTAKVDPSVDLEFVRSNDNVVAGDIDAAADGAYNLGSPANKFNTAYATSFPAPSTLIYKTKSGVADTIYGAATDGVPAAFFQSAWGAGFTADIAYQSELQPVKAASIFDHSNLTVSRAADIAYQTELMPVKAASIWDHTNLGVARAADITYQTELKPVKAASIFDHSNLTVSRGADIAYQSELMPVKFDDVFDHSNLGSDKATDIVYHGNFNLPSAEARDKVAKSTYGMAGDLVGVKGLSKQVTEKRDFAFRTETPNHAYWHRMYNTPAAFETVYQDYTTSMQKKETTPSKSAPGTADPNPQPGACWSVSVIPDGTQIGNFGASGPICWGLTWDGTYLWDANTGADYIYQMKTDGTQAGGFDSPSPNPHEATWDGEYFWINGYNASYVYHLRTDGTQIGGFTPTPSPPVSLTWDGAYLWYVAGGGGYIYQLETDGTQVKNFVSPGSNPQGLTWDGTYLWNSDSNANCIYQLKTDGTQVSVFTTPAPDTSGLAWDGAYLWNSDSDANCIYQLGNAGNFDVNYRIFAK